MTKTVAEKGEALVSDDMVAEDFKRGWALHSFGTGVAHIWFRRPGSDFAQRLCGSSLVHVRIANGQTGLLHPGNFPRCGRCSSSENGRHR